MQSSPFWSPPSYYSYRRSNTVRLTSKGQVTIPQEFREKLGLHPGTEVEFDVPIARMNGVAVCVRGSAEFAAARSTRRCN
jgi:AbrB family looped-hinge helix DNA binding protein